MITLLIQLVIIIAIFAVVWWFVSSVPLPEPVRIVCYALAAILAILLLVRVFPVGSLRVWP